MQDFLIFLICLSFDSVDYESKYMLFTVFSRSMHIKKKSISIDREIDCILLRYVIKLTDST